MRIGINVGTTVSGRPATLDEITTQVAGIGRRGFAFAGFAHIRGFDALTTIALVGRAVPELELATAVVPIYARHPVAMAQQALTTQAAVEGRLTLGIGLSHRRVVENAWGLSFEQPLKFMQEYLSILMPLLRGEAVSFAGERLSSEVELSLPPTPVPPVLLAALGERMLRLAGAQTDGTALWMVGARTLEHHVVPTITAAAQAAGRRPPRVIVGLPICVTDDAAEARARAARGFAMYGQLPSYRAMLDHEGVDGPADVAIVGNEAEVQGQLDRLESAGGTEFSASVFGSADDQQRTFEFLASKVADGRRSAV